MQHGRLTVVRWLVIALASLALAALSSLPPWQGPITADEPCT